MLTLRNLFSSPFFNVSMFVIFWAIQIFITKVAFVAGADILALTIQSGIIAFMLLTLYVLLFKRHTFKQLSKTILIGLLLANAIHGGLGFFFNNAGIALTTAINAGFLVQVATVTTALLAWIILKEKMTSSKMFLLILIIVGALLLITKGKLDSPQIGDILLILACLSWSTGNVLVRKILKKHPIDSDLVTFFRPIAGLPLIFIAIAFAPLFPSSIQPVFQTNFFNLTYINYAFACAIFIVLLWIFLNRTLKLASASYMTMMGSLTPVLVAILALLFLGESLEGIQWVGALLIIFAGFSTYLLKIDKH
ncbi:MAG TPA: DMT family transporter [Patescibacteria group bacterium]|nr:DMT family transporter [Patescibacteria group bacterium]